MFGYFTTQRQDDDLAPGHPFSSAAEQTPVQLRFFPSLPTHMATAGTCAQGQLRGMPAAVESCGGIGVSTTRQAWG